MPFGDAMDFALGIMSSVGMGFSKSLREIGYRFNAKYICGRGQGRGQASRIRTGSCARLRLVSSNRANKNIIRTL